MAEIVLNPDINGLEEREPGRYTIFQTLLQGFKEANNVTPPDYSKAPFVTETGEFWTDPEGNQIPLTIPNEGAIAAKMAEIAEIQMQNSAYLFARVMGVAAESASGGIDITKFVSKNGDTMLGMFGALRGFEAGYEDQKIFDVSINTAKEKIAHVYGSLIVDDDVTVEGQLNLSDEGIYFSKHQSIYFENNTLCFDSENFLFTGDVNIDGSLKLGDVTISESGIYWGEKEFYHSGNCNNQKTDWSMKDAHVYGDLIIEGDSTFSGRLKALRGFDLGENDKKLFFSSYDELTEAYKITMSTDLDIVEGNGIKFDNEYIIKVRDGADWIISFSAPGRVLNLGDSGGTEENPLPTQYISLQADIKNDRNTYTMISSNGDGDFRNSFQAGCANSGPIVIRTYFLSDEDCGVVFPKRIALGNEHGPNIYTDDNIDRMIFSIPHTYVEKEAPVTAKIPFELYYDSTGYPWRNQSLTNDISLFFDTAGEYFVFQQPILAKSLSIQSDKYQTRLDENVLFFNTGIFIEGVNDGLAFTGNAYFNGNIGSTRFASGYSGYGWAVNKNETTGNIVATFDELVVRKRMRIYEQEVQKQNIINGSWWVTDSCSGDLVEVV